MTTLAAHFHGELTTLGWVGLIASGLVCAWVIWRAVRYSVRPGEEDPAHHKYMIFDDDAADVDPKWARTDADGGARGMRSNPGTR